MIVYSIVIQTFIEKTFCKICLLIIAVLLAQIAVSGLFFESIFFANSLILSVIAFLISFFGLIFINDLTSQKEKYRKSNIKNLKFKRNYDIFKRELLGKEKINFRNREIFFLGNKNAKIHISLISNPYCGFCKAAHQILEKLLKKYPNEISAQIRFNYFENNTDENYKNLMNNFVNLWQNSDSETFFQALGFWFENRDEEKFKQKFDKIYPEADLFPIIQSAEENKELGFTFTPLFLINGHEFPDKYDRKDIFYFVEELIEDEDFTNEKKPNYER